MQRVSTQEIIAALERVSHVWLGKYRVDIRRSLVDIKSLTWGYEVQITRDTFNKRKNAWVSWHAIARLDDLLNVKEAHVRIKYSPSQQMNGLVFDGQGIEYLTYLNKIPEFTDEVRRLADFVWRVVPNWENSWGCQFTVLYSLNEEGLSEYEMEGRQKNQWLFAYMANRHEPINVYGSQDVLKAVYGALTKKNLAITVACQKEEITVTPRDSRSWSVEVFTQTVETIVSPIRGGGI